MNVKVQFEKPVTRVVERLQESAHANGVRIEYGISNIFLEGEWYDVLWVIESAL